MMNNAFNPNAEDTRTFDRELLPAKKPLMARCARIIEIGKQASQYGVHNKAVIALNLPDFSMDIGGESKQRMLSNPYGINMSNNENSSMRQYSKALNPDASCLGDFLNHTCQVTVVHYTKGNGETGEKIDSIAPLIAGIEVPPLDIEPYWFEWNNPDGDVWALVPEFTRTLIQGAVNYPGSLVEEMVNALEGTSNDDIPL
jgi:hypothetical protein